MTGRPDVPRPAETDPLIETIPIGAELVQVFPRERGLLSFNPTTAAGRFRPSTGSDGEVVPTAYLASDSETALAEGILRGVSALMKGHVPRRLYRREIHGVSIGTVRIVQPIRVARLHGLGLNRLGLTRGAIIDCEEDEYPYTARWARAIWGSRRRPAGLAWTSKQNDTGRAFMLWETRVPTGAFEPKGSIMDLDHEPGLDLVRQACVDAKVDFEG